jgi:hypothetical protein
MGLSPRELRQIANDPELWEPGDKVKLINHGDGSQFEGKTATLIEPRGDKNGSWYHRLDHPIQEDDEDEKWFTTCGGLKWLSRPSPKSTPAERLKMGGLGI